MTSLTINDISAVVPAQAIGASLRETFQSPWDQFADRVGEPFTVTGVVTEPDDAHDAEVLPMFIIRFTRDGLVTEAWPEEILTGQGWEPQ